MIVSLEAIASTVDPPNWKVIPMLSTRLRRTHGPRLGSAAPFGRAAHLALGVALGMGLAWMGASASQPGGGACNQNGDCPPGHYCQKAAGDCDGPGACVEKPLACVPVIAPVCGCDGVTYMNACEAAKVGANVKHLGACVPGACSDNGDCLAVSYCKKAVGDCDGNGVCAERPENCPAVFAPVCGCNGVTYMNACEAAKAGINVAAEGACRWSCSADLNHDGIVNGADLAIVLGSWGPCP